MMKYELENFMKPFLGEIEIIIELDDNNKISVGISEAEHYIDAFGTGHVRLIPACVLTRRKLRG